MIIVTRADVIAGSPDVADVIDFHRKPQEMLFDGPQALLLEELEHFVRDAELVRACYYEKRRKLRDQLGAPPGPVRRSPGRGRPS